MLVTFEDTDLQALIEERKPCRRYKKYLRDGVFMNALDRVMALFDEVESTADLTIYSFLHYEKLKNTMNISSVRVLNNRIERILFRENEQGIEIVILELNSDHYGNKK